MNYTETKVTENGVEYTVHEYSSGDRVWLLGDKLSRTNGPAVELANGKCGWYLDDKWLTEEEHARLTSPTNEVL